VEGTDVWLKIAAMSSLQIFEVTNGVTTVVAVVNPKDKYNSYLSFKEASEKVGLKQLNAEVACLLCEKITKKDFQEMGVPVISRLVHDNFLIFSSIIILIPGFPIQTIVIFLLAEIFLITITPSQILLIQHLHSTELQTKQ
jgi:hypothetical protein